MKTTNATMPSLHSTWSAARRATRVLNALRRPLLLGALCSSMFACAVDDDGGDEATTESDWTVRPTGNANVSTIRLVPPAKTASALKKFFQEGFTYQLREFDVDDNDRHLVQGSLPWGNGGKYAISSFAFPVANVPVKIGHETTLRMGSISVQGGAGVIAMRSSYGIRERERRHDFYDTVPENAWLVLEPSQYKLEISKGGAPLTCFRPVKYHGEQEACARFYATDRFERHENAFPALGTYDFALTAFDASQGKEVTSHQKVVVHAEEAVAFEVPGPVSATLRGEVDPRDAVTPGRKSSYFGELKCPGKAWTASVTSKSQSFWATSNKSYACTLDLYGAQVPVTVTGGEDLVIVTRNIEFDDVLLDGTTRQRGTVLVYRWESNDWKFLHNPYMWSTNMSINVLPGKYKVVTSYEDSLGRTHEAEEIVDLSK